MANEQLVQSVVGVAIMGAGVVGFAKPEWFLNGRRSHFWVKLLGEEGTKKLIRYVSVPIMLIVGAAVLAMGLGLISSPK